MPEIQQMFQTSEVSIKIALPSSSSLALWPGRVRPLVPTAHQNFQASRSSRVQYRQYLMLRCNLTGLILISEKHHKLLPWI